MHAVFYIVGVRVAVDEFLRWAETRTCFMSFENPKMNTEMKDTNGNILSKGKLPVNLGVRYGLFGTYEAIFPEEDMDKVLTLLRFHHQVKGFTDPGLMMTAKIKVRIATLRKALNLDKIPDFNINDGLFLPENIGKHIRVIPIGVRRDRVQQMDNGLIHEAL